MEMAFVLGGEAPFTAEDSAYEAESRPGSAMFDEVAGL
jgi:hypothetical protein